VLPELDCSFTSPSLFITVYAFTVNRYCFPEVLYNIQIHDSQQLAVTLRLLLGLD